MLAGAYDAGLNVGAALQRAQHRSELDDLRPRAENTQHLLPARATRLGRGFAEAARGGIEGLRGVAGFLTRS